MISKKDNKNTEGQNDKTWKEHQNLSPTITHWAN